MPNDLGDLIKDEVTRAESDFQNVRARAFAIVGVSGGLVALVSGLLTVAASVKPSGFLPTDAEVTLGLALIAYAVASVLALMINRPADVTRTDPADLTRSVAEDWDRAEPWDKEVAEFLVSYLTSLRMSNDSNSKWLRRAITAEICAIALTALMAILVVQNLPTRSGGANSSSTTTSTPSSMGYFGR